MALAKCIRCGASATAGTFEGARLLINHAAGLSRGIPCGDNYNCVEEIGEKTTTVKKIVEKINFTKVKPPKNDYSKNIKI